MDQISPRVTELLPALLRYAQRLAGDSHEAEDLVQETLALAYANMASFQPGRPLRVWLFAILHNHYISSVRHKSVHRRYCSEDVSPEAIQPSQEHYIRLRDVADALERLSAEQQQVLHLVAVEGLAYQEAADVLGVPIGTLISRLSRARARLRALDRSDIDPGAATKLRIVES